MKSLHLKKNKPYYNQGVGHQQAVKLQTLWSLLMSPDTWLPVTPLHRLYCTLYSSSSPQCDQTMFSGFPAISYQKRASGCTCFLSVFLIIDIFCFVRDVTRRTSADRKTEVVGVTAPWAVLRESDSGCSQSLCGLGVWSPADGQGGGWETPVNECVCVCLLYPESGPGSLQSWPD